MDWRDGLPPELLRTVESFTVVADSSIGADRVDALRYLLDLLLDSDSQQAIRTWARKHEGSDLVLYENSQGNLQEGAPRSTARQPPPRSVVIPRDLLSSLIREVMVFPDEDERVARQASLREGMDKTLGWLVNHETLLGHLMLAHRTNQVVVKKGHDGLLATHADLHR
jgi:hypothetical protein